MKKQENNEIFFTKKKRKKNYIFHVKLFFSKNIFKQHFRKVKNCQNFSQVFYLILFSVFIFLIKPFKMTYFQYNV